jgi:hypothetical protein
MFRFGDDFCRRAALMSNEEVGQCEERFRSFRAFLGGFLAVPAKKEPARFAASLFNALQ